MVCFYCFVRIRRTKEAKISRQANVVNTLEIIVIVMLLVSRMKAIEIAAVKTPMYRLALLSRNCVNSVRMSL